MRLRYSELSIVLKPGIVLGLGLAATAALYGEVRCYESELAQLRMLGVAQSRVANDKHDRDGCGGSNDNPRLAAVGLRLPAWEHKPVVFDQVAASAALPVSLRSAYPSGSGRFTGVLVLLTGVLLSTGAAILVGMLSIRARRWQRHSDEQTVRLDGSELRLMQDLEARQHAEQELQHAQRVLTVAQKVAHLGSWELDASTGELQCSDEMFRICGLVPQSVKPTVEFVLGLVHPDDRAAAKAAIVSTRDAGTDFKLEKRIVRPDGSVRHVISIGEANVDADGRLVKMAGSILDITEQKETELALRRSQDELRQLAANRERVREDERKHIAREVHDELGGLLTGIKAFLSVSMERAAQRGTAPDVLIGEASLLVDQASDTVRRIITDLRPSVLDQVGVWAALQWYARRIEERTGVACDFTLGEDAAATELDADRSVMVFRIVQEALTNVVRHANAGWAIVRVTRSGDRIMVEVEDDGQGFDSAVAHTPDAWGIVGMHERAHYFGGSFNIASAIGKGTVARLVLPINGSRSEAL